MTRTTRIAIFITVLIGLTLLTISHASAGPSTTTTTTLPPSGGGAVTCTNTLTGTPVSVVTVCENEVKASPSAYCGVYLENENEARAQAICGDALAICGDAGQLAFQVAVTKQTCKNATDVSQDTAVTCGDVASVCSPAFSCPPAPVCPTTFVQEAISRCKSVKVLKGGAIRKRGCTSFLTPEQAYCE